MSLHQFQTQANKDRFFFLLAEASTIVANNIVAKNVSTLTLDSGTIKATDISTTNIQADYVSTFYIDTQVLSSFEIESDFAQISSLVSLNAQISSLVTNNIILDGNTLDTGGQGFGSVLLLNGLPIATGSSTLSSIQDWSFFPAVSTIFMGGNWITNAGNITCQNINNALNVQTDTLTVNSAMTSPSGTITNLRTTNLSSVNLVTSNANVGALTVTTINGQIPISGSNWSQYAAQTTVQLAGNNINTTGSLSVTGSNTMSFTTPNGNLAANNFDISMTGGGVNITADEGGQIASFADINLTAQNGNRGRINLTANGGYSNGVFGEVNLTASGGSVGGVGTGGLITLTANTPIGTPSNLTSAIKFSAAGINSYAGAIPSIGSLVGYNFIYGTVGVNIVAGPIPSLIPNVPGTTYIYGVNGVSLDGINTVEVKATLGLESGNDNYFNSIYPFWGGLSTPPDLLIAGRYIVPNLAQVCVNLSNVRNMYFQSNVATVMSNLDTLAMSGTGSITTSNLGTQVGSANTFTTTTLNATTVAGLTASAQITNMSNIGTNNINTNFINGIPTGAYVNTIVSTFQTASISSARISSINGIGLSNLINQTVSTFQTASISSATISSINKFISFASNAISQGMVVQGDLPLLQVKNTDPGGQKTTVNLIATDNNMLMEVYNSNSVPLNMIFSADNFGFNVPSPAGGFEMDISGATQIRGSLTVSGMNTSSILTPNTLSVSSITNLKTVNGYIYPWTSTLGGLNAVSSFVVDGTTATTPQLIGKISFPYGGDYFLTQKVAFTKLTGGVAQDCHGILLLNSGTLPTFPGGGFGMGSLPYTNENGASTFTTVITNIQLLSSGTKEIYYYDSTGNNYTASLITDAPVMHFNPGPPI